MPLAAVWLAGVCLASPIGGESLEGASFLSLAATEPAGLVVAAPIALSPLQGRLATKLLTAGSGSQLDVRVEPTVRSFEELARGSLDALLASRPISRSESMRFGDREFVEVPLALDALVVMASPANDWLDYLTTDELSRAWSGVADNWSDLRPDWPHAPISLHAVEGESLGELLGVLPTSEGLHWHGEAGGPLQAVESDSFSLGVADLAAVRRADNSLWVVPIDAGDGPVMPTEATVRKADYPLSRQLWLYADAQNLVRPGAAEIVERLAAEAGEISTRLGYVSLPETIQEQARRRLEARLVGSVFADGVSGAAKVYGERALDPNHE